MLHKYTNFFEPPVYFTSLDAGSTKNRRRFTAHRTTAANYLYLNLAPLSRCKAMTPQRSQIRHLFEFNFPGMTHKAPPVGPSCQQEERLIHPGISRDVISQRRSWRLWGNIWSAAPHDTRCKNRNMHALNQMELSLYSFYSFFLPLTPNNVFSMMSNAACSSAVTPHCLSLVQLISLSGHTLWSLLLRALLSVPLSLPL